jgi:peptidoglycan/LPS O-acetylase OafA/YrhL
VPLLLAGSVVLLWYPRRWTTGPVTAVAGVYAGGVAAAVSTASPVSIISVEYGATVALVGSVLLALGYLLTVRITVHLESSVTK